MFDENQIDKYFNKHLVQLVDEITTSQHAREHPHSQSVQYQEARHMRVRMVIVLMCFTMIPFCNFFETLLGLVCYSFGLRDGGFSIFNLFGVTSSIDHIIGMNSYGEQLSMLPK